MKLCARIFSALAACLLFDACTTSATTKVEVRDRLVSQFTKKANYLTLARYWDDHAEKMTIDFKGASFLTVWDKESKAEITIGNGPYYGMIGLVGLDENTTLIKSYAWGGMADRIDVWQKMLRNPPENR